MKADKLIKGIEFGFDICEDSEIAREIRRIILDYIETPQSMNEMIMTMYNNMNSCIKEQREMKECLMKVNKDVESLKSS